MAPAGRTEPAVRQLVSRARKHVAGERKIPVPETTQRRLLATFLEAARSGDLEALERLFAADVASISDGNGARQVSRKVVSGAARVVSVRSRPARPRPARRPAGRAAVVGGRGRRATADDRDMAVAEAEEVVDRKLTRTHIV